MTKVRKPRNARKGDTVDATFNYEGLPYIVELQITSKPHQIDYALWVDFENGLSGHWNSFLRYWDIGIGATGLTEDLKRQFINDGRAQRVNDYWDR